MKTHTYRTLNVPLKESEIDYILNVASIQEPSAYWEWATDAEGQDFINRTIKKYGSIREEY